MSTYSLDIGSEPWCNVVSAGSSDADAGQVCHGCQLSEGDVEAIWILTHIYDIWLFLLEKQTGG